MPREIEFASRFATVAAHLLAILQGARARLGPADPNARPARPAALTSVILVLVSLLVPTVLPSPADAVSLNISIGTNLNTGRRISCSEGARRIRDRGFRDVRSVDCRGRYFVYRARRGRNNYEIAVRRSNGRVVDVHRIGRR